MRGPVRRTGHRIRYSMMLPILLACASLQGNAPDSPFPPSTAIAEGLDPAALEALDDLVRGFVADGDVPGAEILVIRNRRTVLHSAHGLRDTDPETPMEPGTVHCVRSMTKPLIGAAIRMLAREKALGLDDPVADHLPSFDAESTRGITIEHLLLHTSGLPMSLIMGTDPRDLESTRQVADLGGGAELAFAPGEGFQYSDQGTDTLTAIIAEVTGAPAEAFLRARILEPLGMTRSACILGEAHPLRAATAASFAGSPGNWNRVWGPEEPPLFPVFLGSQGLYSSAVDYARFLDMWLRRGRGPEARVMKASSVRRALEAGPHPMSAPTGFAGLEVRYGSQMQLWVRPADGAEGGRDELVAFGHTGSDGTAAWAFPDSRTLVVYMTQARFSPTALRVEEALGRLLLGEPFDPISAAPPLDQYLGYYCEDSPTDRYRAIVRDGEGLALDILGKTPVPLLYAGGDRWKLKPRPATVIEFDRDDQGRVTGYHIGDHREFRVTPTSDLPEARDVAARVADTHRVGRLAELGGLELEGTVTVESLGKAGTWRAVHGPAGEWRVDESFPGGESAGAAFDGSVTRTRRGSAAAEIVPADIAPLLAMNGLAARFDPEWADATVIQRIEREDAASILLVRLGDTSAPAATAYVDTERWLVARIDGPTHVPGLGRIGRSLEFGDFRAIEGMYLPFKARLRIDTGLVGTVISTTTEHRVGPELPAGLFRLE